VLLFLQGDALPNFGSRYHCKPKDKPGKTNFVLLFVSRMSEEGLIGA
jgi:hypothetical protein